MTDQDLPSPELRQTRLPTLSWVWLMPLAAVIISGVVVWQTFADQGPVITLEFPSASGIEAGQTALRYRDVQVGLVERVGFSEGLAAVEVDIRVDKSVAPYLDTEAEFWLVEPEVSVRGITGLETVLTGVFIEGLWDQVIGIPAIRFEARESAPLALPGEDGTRVTLVAPSAGQLAAGSPVLFRGIEVGRLDEPVFSDSGSFVLVDAFIQAPFDQRITTTTRFWDASGFSVSLSTEGLSLNLDSLASLVEGGVSFGTFVTGGARVEDGTQFDLFDSESHARDNALEGEGGTELDLAVFFPEIAAPITVGTPVRYQGFRVGQVTDIIGQVDAESFDGRVGVLISFTVNLRRLGFPGDADNEAHREELTRRVRDGLRARITSVGLLAQTQELELAVLPESPRADLEFDASGVPLIPPAPSATTDGGSGIDDLMDRMASLPVEELFESVIDVLDGVARLVRSPALQQVPENTNALLVDARTLLSDAELDQALADVRTATAALSGLVKDVASSDGVAALLTALEQSDPIARDLEAFAATLPGLSDDLVAITARLAQFPVETLGEDLRTALATANAILSDPAIARIAPSVAANLTTLEALLTDLEAQKLGDGLSSTISAINETAADLQATSAQLPGVLNSVDALISGAAEVDLATLSMSLDSVLQGVSSVVSAPGAEDLPDSLNAALTEFAAVMAELNGAGAVDSLTSTLASADQTLAAIESAAAELPALVSRLDALTVSIASAAASYDEGSPLYSSLLRAMRDVAQTSEAFRSLARTIERNPNSLLTGR
ncbi:MAG: MlaD family protein [Pseudomonadota bacterium]